MKKKKSVKRRKLDIFLILLALLSLVFLISVVRYSLRTFQIPEWDEQYYMYMASGFYRMLQEPTLHTPLEILQFEPQKQPGYPLFVLPFLLIFGLSDAYFWALFTNGLFYAVSIFGIYFIARCYLSKLSSFLAAFIFTFYGWTLYHVHLAYTETSTAAFCIWAVYFLIKSDLFQNKKYSLLFGLFFGLGLLTRWVTLIFVLGPLLYVLFKAFKNGLLKKRKTFIHLGLAAGVLLLLSFFPYYSNFYWVAGYFSGHRFGGEMWQVVPEHERNPFSLYSLTFYLSSFEQLGIFFFVLFIAGVVFALRKKSTLKIFLFAVLIPWIFFSFLSILKADRFIVPIYPFIAILSAYTFEVIKNQKIKTGLIIVTVLLSLGTFFGSVWARGPMKADRATIPIYVPFGQTLNIHLTTIAHPPDLYKKSGEEIVEYIITDSKKRNIAKPKVTALYSYKRLDDPVMVHNMYYQEKPLDINNYVGTVTTDPEKQVDAFIIDIMDESDYLLIKDKNKTDGFFPEINYVTLKALNKVFDRPEILSKYFEKKTQIWITQDSSIVTIYARKKNVKNENFKEMKKELVDILK